MADIRTSGMGGVPKGATADRPSGPSIGDVFYNGTLGCLEIYTAQGWVANSAPPGIPTIGTTTYSATNKAYNNSSASVAFTPGEGGGLPNSYRATSSPGSYSGTGTSSPIVVEGLQSGTAYTFSVTGTNNFGTSASSVSSNSITANTVPNIPGTPVAEYASSTSATLTFTAGATGGSSITNYKYSTDGTNFTALSPAQTSSPLTISGLTELSTYTFYIKAVNANGDSESSLSSNSLFIGPVVTGGTLTSDSTYYYRTFTGNGTLTVANSSIPISSILIAGGGGGGGGSAGAGGGAGGLLYTSGSTVSTGSYSVVIGSGGLGKAGNSGPGTGGDWGDNGGNTTFNSLTAIGGGGGGGEDGSRHPGQNGGSGGGTCYFSGYSPGSGTSGQGNNGGYGNTGYWAGGGGGAGAAGGNSSYGTSAGGNGGSGSNAYASWLTAISSAMTGVSGWSTATSTGYIAGGGGGAAQNNNLLAGSGGAGGGGAGAADNNSGSGPSTGGISGTANTGGGGGGNPEGNLRSNLGNGGSGIAILRYAKSAVGG